MKITNEIKVILIVLGVILIGYLAQKYFADRTLTETKASYDARIDRYQADSSKQMGKAQLEKDRADSLARAADKQAGLYGQSAATIATLKQTIRDQQAQLSMGQQIDVIGNTLGKQYRAEVERIKAVATPGDSDLVAELYRRVRWGELQAAKLDTSLRENARLRVANDALTTREAAYNRTLVSVQQSLLTEAETERFLGIGRKRAMRQLAQSVGDQVSELEKELNGH